MNAESRAAAHLTLSAPAVTAVCALEIFKGGGYRIWLSRAA
jgi:hypothetical protein